MWYHIAATTSAVPTRKMRKDVHGRRSPRLAGGADACPSGSWPARFTGASRSRRLVMRGTRQHTGDSRSPASFGPDGVEAPGRVVETVENPYMWFRRIGSFRNGMG